MKKRCQFTLAMAILLFVLPILVSCSMPASVTASIQPAETITPVCPSEKPTHHVGTASPSWQPYIPSPTDSWDEEGEWEEGEDWEDSGYDYLPMSIPKISDADWQTFNSDLLMDYLAQEACHENRIEKAEMIDGVLYLTVSDNPYFWHVDEAYCFLKEQFSLSDEEILALPLFSGCLIEDEMMFLSEEDYIKWNADDPEDFFDDFGYIALDQVMFDPVPVAADATVTLFDYDETWEYYDLTMSEFTDYVLNGRTASDFEADDIYLDSMVFGYSDGVITAILQVNEQPF